MTRAGPFRFPSRSSISIIPSPVVYPIQSHKPIPPANLSHRNLPFFSLKEKHHHHHLQCPNNTKLSTNDVCLHLRHQKHVPHPPKTTAKIPSSPLPTNIFIRSCSHAFSLSNTPLLDSGSDNYTCYIVPPPEAPHFEPSRSSTRAGRAVGTTRRDPSLDWSGTSVCWRCFLSLFHLPPPLRCLRSESKLLLVPPSAPISWISVSILWLRFRAAEMELSQTTYDDTEGRRSEIRSWAPVLRGVKNAFRNGICTSTFQAGG